MQLLQILPLVLKYSSEAIKVTSSPIAVIAVFIAVPSKQNCGRRAAATALPAAIVDPHLSLLPEPLPYQYACPMEK